MGAGFDLATVDRLLTTTRAVRRRLDLERPVEPDVVEECIALSQQAPTGSNRQTWRWIVVRDADRRRQVAEIYARGLPAIRGDLASRGTLDPPTERVYSGALWLAEHLAEVPVLVLPCVIGRPPERFTPVLAATAYGSILPAVWSFQLALRSRGLGSTFTTLHLLFETEMAALLGIPDDVLQVALLPVAYTKGGDFEPAARPPPGEIIHWDGWEPARPRDP
jgi:nitroreductase